MATSKGKIRSNRRVRRAMLRVGDWFQLKPGPEREAAFKRALRDVHNAGFLRAPIFGYVADKADRR